MLQRSIMLIVKGIKNGTRAPEERYRKENNSYLHSPTKLSIA